MFSSKSFGLKRSVAIEKGTELMRCSPFCYILSNSQTSRYCSTCLCDNSSLQRCSLCKFVHYCSKRCQKTNWRNHKRECKLLSRWFPNFPSDHVRFFLHVLLKTQEVNKRKQETQSSPLQEVELKSRSFDDLMSNKNAILSSDAHLEDFEKVVEDLMRYADSLIGESFNIPDKSELLEIYGKIATNSFGLYDYQARLIGTALYLPVSVINHSCLPNAVPIFYGVSVAIVAARDIDPNEPITISYIDLPKPRKERRSLLENQYFFTCWCNLCSDPNDEHENEFVAAACVDSKCKGFVCLDDDDFTSTTSSSFTCTKCHKEPDNEWIKSYHDGVKIGRKIVDDKLLDVKLTKCPDAVYDEGQNFLMKFEKYFYRHNLVLFQVLTIVFDACISQQNFFHALLLAKMIVGTYKHYGIETNIAVLHMMIGKLEAYQDNKKAALEALMLAKNCLKGTYKSDHPLWRQLEILLRRQ